jgi:hypothetical protein
MSETGGKGASRLCGRDVAIVVFSPFDSLTGRVLYECVQGTCSMKAIEEHCTG